MPLHHYCSLQRLAHFYGRLQGPQGPLNALLTELIYPLP